MTQRMLPVVDKSGKLLGFFVGQPRHEPLFKTAVYPPVAIGKVSISDAATMTYKTVTFRRDKVRACQDDYGYEKQWEAEQLTVVEGEEDLGLLPMSIFQHTAVALGRRVQ